MAEGARVGTAHVTIEPDLSAAAFAAEGRVASRMFNSAFADSIGHDMRAMAAAFSRHGDEIGRNLSYGVSTGMGTMRSAFSAASDAIHGISSSLTTVGYGLQNVGSQAVFLGHSLTAVITGPLAVAAAGLSYWGLKTGMNLEDAKIGLRAMLPPGYDVEALMGRLVKLATSSPVFAIDQVTQFTRKLVGAGVEAGKAELLLDAINKIFITYGVTGESASKALLGVSQVFSKGKVQAEELTGQIGEQIPIWHLLSEATGISQSSLMHMSKTGQLTAEMFGDMLLQVGQLPSVTKGAAQGVGTLSAQLQMMKEQTQTVLGLAFEKNFDRIKASLDRLQPALEIFLGWFVSQIPVALEWANKLAGRIEDVARWWDALNPKQQNVALSFIGIAAAVGPVISVLGTMTSALGGLFAAMGFLLTPWGLVLGAIAAALVLIAKHLYDVWKAGGDVRDIFQKISDVVQTIWKQYLLPALKELHHWFDKNILPVLRALATFFQTTILPIMQRYYESVFRNILPALRDLWSTIERSLIPAFKDLIAAIGHDNIKKFIGFLIEIAFWLAERIPVALGRFIGGIRLAIEVVSLLIHGVAFIIQGFRDLEGRIDSFAGVVRRSFGDVRGEWREFERTGGEVWASIVRFGDDAWNKITGLFRGIGDFFGNVFGGARDRVYDAFNSIGDKVNWIKGHFWSIVDRVWDVAHRIWEAVEWAGSSIKNAWNYWLDYIKILWNNLGNGIRGVVNWIIDGINVMIAGFNRVVDAVNSNPLGIHIPFYISSIGHWAKGGLISGPGSETSDSVPGMLSRGEYVINADAVKMFGSRFFDALNRGQVPASSPIALGNITTGRGGLSPQVVNVTIHNELDGEVITRRAQAVVDSNNRATVSTLRAGRRLG